MQTNLREYCAGPQYKPRRNAVAISEKMEQSIVTMVQNGGAFRVLKSAGADGSGYDVWREI